MIKINYHEIVKANPWITKKNQKCILSPDSDGLLCGLFMSNYLNWEIIGFYDGKVHLIKDGITETDDDVCFLDVEIYRRGVRSIGHHMLSIYNSCKPPDWDDILQFCIQPNLLRGFDKNNFNRKYPLATIHLLIGILSSKYNIDVDRVDIFPLLFTDGTYKVMFSYPENVMEWWSYLDVRNVPLLNKLFYNDSYLVYQLMEEMDIFFRERDTISIHNERGDRLRISDRDGNPFNIVQSIHGLYNINDTALSRCEDFLRILERHTGWNYNSQSWNFKDLQLKIFNKESFIANNMNITQVNYRDLLTKDPLSWAMTSTNNIEYTLGVF